MKNVTVAENFQIASISIMDIQFHKNREAYKRMFMEFLLVTYNNIMSKTDYSFALNRWIIYKDEYYKSKIERHYDSIDWLMNHAIGSICFDILKLNHLTQKDIQMSIVNKFYASKKYVKFFKDYANGCN